MAHSTWQTSPQLLASFLVGKNMTELELFKLRYRVMEEWKTWFRNMSFKASAMSDMYCFHIQAQVMDTENHSDTLTEGSPKIDIQRQIVQTEVKALQHIAAMQAKFGILIKEILELSSALQWGGSIQSPHQMLMSCRIFNHSIVNA
ncbi:hypothetical protein BDN71DRAFT_1430172 [Pleurotus eryngii]|uniref:Uncharacterized protein n=1 Tax=Pleurotus eryngii TaxID=5323 RepID=A0A9P5ZYG1_PLEER|nr:hypothetical protein BDN71DRAFT_1430172 [Pleurotus eryngii]